MKKLNMTNTWDTVHTVVINLPKDIERRKFMEEQLRHLSMPHMVLSATDGRTYDFTGIYDEDKATREHGTPLTAPEKGCALSHREALRTFLDSGKEYGLILEDDVVLGKDLLRGMEYAFTRKNWSYIQFNYGPVGFRGIRLWWFLLLQNKRKISLLTLIKGVAANVLSLLWGLRDDIYLLCRTHKLVRPVRDQYLAGCYLLTREAAEALIALNTPLTYTADRIQNIARRKGLIQHRVYVPRIVRQKRESFASSINNDHFGKEIIAA
jgi:GR25 family glycosyltransferase involved in LPS biosynthesis